jgi:hypothetical protein
MSTQFPIYTTHGDWVAMLIGRYIHSREGYWIGWVDADSHVFSVRGEYAGWLSKDFRVLRHRDVSVTMERRQPPPLPPKPELPLNVPLPPLMAELTYDTIDLLEDAAQLLDPFDMDQVEDID